jgi:uncharacterized membrane protein
MMKFQIERIALFSDAVFAIAITLMMIEIKPPHIPHGMSFADSLGVLEGMIGHFVGVILSFVLVGIYWIRHHEFMKHLVGYTDRLLFFNLCFLLTIAFIPFSTSFVFENPGTLLPWLFYNFNLIAASLLSLLLLVYVHHPKNGLCSAEAKDEDLPAMKREIIFPILIYVLVIVLALFNPDMAGMGYAAFSLEAFLHRKKKVPAS